MEYTKGEWYVSLNGKIMIKSGEQFTEICQMPFGSAREADEMPEADANAHLIASSPRLYEALAHILVLDDNYNHGLGQEYFRADVIKLVKEALALAENK